jgi:3-hydroxybutyryl-CoA dehydrogenase
VIACGVAAVASTLGDVRLLARSDASAWRAEEKAQAGCKKVDGGVPERVRVTTDPADLADCDLVIESIVEDRDAKVQMLRVLGESCPDADLGTTTSALSVTELAERSGLTDRVFGFHVFNPVPRMQLVELCLPEAVRDGVRERAQAWCRGLGKTPVEVPDHAGYVVNRLLFPYVFDAVRLMERTGMEPADIDSCMKLGAGYPMGPLALIDFIGLDVCQAVGEELHAAWNEDSTQVPETINRLVAEGKLGRKTGAGFYTY